VDALPPSETAARAPLLAAAVQRWLRYAVPLTALSAIALAPVIALALRTVAPTDRAALPGAVARGWMMVALAWLCQLVLVGAAMAVARAEPSQLRAFTGGLARLVRAIVPCLAAAAAIAIGGLALAVPGVVLMALLALTGASDQRGLPAPLVDSIGFGRRHLRAVSIATGAMIALDAAIGLAGVLAFAHADRLAMARHLAPAIAAALVVASPLPATVLAMLRAREP
jgi:hypothetical protein